MIDGLAYLRIQTADMLTNVAPFVTVTDGETAEEVERQSAGLLNPPNLLNELLSRYS
jgi:hypothetical protein